MRKGSGKSAEERFWKYVKKTDYCWEWTGGKLLAGYGQFSPTFGNNMGAHRFSYTLVHGPIPDGLHVRHACDNRSCVNPEHLELGTHEDNMHDMVLRGRHHAHGKTGMVHQKLKNGDDRVIYGLHAEHGMTINQLAEMFDVSVATVTRMMRSGKNKELSPVL